MINERPIQTLSSAITPSGYQLPGGFNPTTMGGTINIPSPISALAASPVNTSNRLKSNFSNMSPMMQGQTIGGIAGGIAGIAGGIIGGRARRQEQRAAKAELAQRQQAYEQFQFINPYEGLENVYEDARVSTQAAEFQAQQQQQSLAQTLDALRSAGGGAGAAAVAQALAQQQARNIQATSADIAKQEQQIEMAKMGEASRLQQLEAGGRAQQQAQEFERTETLFGMGQQRKAAADEARRQATQSLVGGIGELVGGAASLLMPVPGM